MGGAIKAVTASPLIAAQTVPFGSRFGGWILRGRPGVTLPALRVAIRLPGARSGQRVRQLAELLEASVRHSAMRRCTLGGMAPNVRFPKTLARPARAGSGRRRCVDGEVLELNLSSRRLRKDFLRLLLKYIHRADVWDWTVANARDAQLGETFIRGHAVHNHNIHR